MKFHNPRQNCLPPSSHETNVLNKFHENWAKNVTSTVFTCFIYIHIQKNAPPTGGHVFSRIQTIFKLAKLVTSRVFTRFLYSQIGKTATILHIEKNAPPTGGHVFSSISTIFELV
ncbi:hypothetical protein DPMN_025749 [Dreissena polymorpha]|uniref:Uncharacterized protein n=1 Tax=Dreissena polymorpha TaxID=45954 RepID=A0A9D4LPU7_DREPO|nr:hypothetical protein DPMN_025749 [Dreissena polymorpha]